MDNIFITVANMSINATYIAVAVILFKFIIKKSPRWIHCLLWALVSVRLIFPFSFKSNLSVIPSSKPIPHEITVIETPQIKTGITHFNNAVNTMITNELVLETDSTKTTIMNIVESASIIWVIGCVVLILYAIYSYIKVKRKVYASINITDNVYICDNISTPFILGVFKPKIYLPSNTLPDEHKMILAHENAHIKRFDHLWKPFAYLLLCIYWFNPVLWIAYIMLCKDIELACDERVIKNFSSDEKKCYTASLLNSSIKKRFITACPLAFGETDVKSRVRNVFNYKKPAFWVIIISIILCALLIVFFLTDPIETVKENEIAGISDVEYFSDIDGISAEIISLDLSTETPSVTVLFSSEFEKEVIFGDSYCVYKHEDGEWIDCDRTPNDVWFLIGYPLSNGGVFKKTYTLTTHDLDENGRYKFETDFIVSGESPDKDGVRKKYNIGFTFTLETPVPFSEENISKFYNFNDALQLKFMNSPDPVVPCIRINRIDGMYMFTYSGFSSHVSIGEFDLFIDRLVLRELGNDNVYIFKRGDNGFEFVKDASSMLPKYSYSAGADPQEPVPDGAVFKWDNSIDFISNVYDLATSDVDGDGIEEKYTLSAGVTSGLFTFVLNVKEADYQKSAVFRSEWVNPRFFKADNKLKISATTQSDRVLLWDVEFDGENLNIPQLYYESNPPSTAKVNYGYVTEVGKNNKYIIVSEGNDGYIHTNNSEFAQNEFFKFYTDSQKTAFRIGDKVRIIHTGEFSYETVDDAVPTGVLISLIEIIV